jgi:hypothetical protein
MCATSFHPLKRDLITNMAPAGQQPHCYKIETHRISISVKINRGDGNNQRINFQQPSVNLTPQRGHRVQTCPLKSVTQTLNQKLSFAQTRDNFTNFIS